MSEPSAAPARTMASRMVRSTGLDPICGGPQVSRDAAETGRRRPAARRDMRSTGLEPVTLSFEG
jgi:hypothetical protein